MQPSNRQRTGEKTIIFILQTRNIGLTMTITILKLLIMHIIQGLTWSKLSFVRSTTADWEKEEKRRKEANRTQETAAMTVSDTRGSLINGRGLVGVACVYGRGLYL